MNAMKASSKTSRPFRIKRVYEPAAKDEGFRVLVDRLWPRGMSKEKVQIDLWLKDVAPSDALRRRVHGDPTKWDAFVADYRSELEREPARSAVASLRERAECQPVTLLYASRDEIRNNAVVLKAWLDKMK